MKKLVWILKDFVLSLHEELLSEHGGTPGIRDEGLLDSALARPQNIHSYGNTDLFTLATAYITGIIRNHPFIDGNKRTAFMTGYVFLSRNGKELIADEAEATQIMLALASTKVSEEDFALWIKKNCQ
jgi:death-on-curing protein